MVRDLFVFILLVSFYHTNKQYLICKCMRSLPMHLQIHVIISNKANQINLFRTRNDNRDNQVQTVFESFQSIQKNVCI